MIIMKHFKYEYLFYLTTVFCFCFVLYSVVSQSPDTLPPKEYIYVLNEESSEVESRSEQELPSEASVSEASFYEVSSGVASRSKEKAPIKKYISSSASTSSSVQSSEVTSQEESDIEEESSQFEENVPSSRQTSKPPVEDTTSIVNINTATQAQLMTLTGIGEVISKRIIDMRDSIGGFKSIDEIMLVPGIGEKTFEKIASRITV